jgi:hypothetical protein
MSTRAKYRRHLRRLPEAVPNMRQRWHGYASGLRAATNRDPHPAHIEHYRDGLVQVESVRSTAALLALGVR